MPIATTVFPESQQWFGIGREVTSGTVVQPVLTVPMAKGEPDEKVTWLDDKSIRGYMAVDYNLIQGVECAEFALDGPVYMDSIGYFLHNIFGDYQAAGTTGSPTWTAPGGVTAGAGPITVTTGTAATAGTFIQIGTSAPTEVVKVGTGSTVTSIVIDPTTPIRYAHTGSTTINTVTAPFTHTFALLNSGNGQPATHTITHHQGISGTYGARQYSYFCASDMDFTMNSEELFMHSTKGTSFLGVPAAASPTNVASTVPAQPDWRFLVGIGGPASGGTLISNVINGGVTIARAVKPFWTLDGAQAPYVIARNGLEITGKFTHLAQDESPMLNMLNNVQPQLQMTMTNGLSGANLVAVTFNVQVGAYETSKINAADEIQYDVTWRGIANTTNVGFSAGQGPATVVIQNAWPTY